MNRYIANRIKNRWQAGTVSLLIAALPAASLQAWGYQPLQAQNYQPKSVILGFENEEALSAFHKIGQAAEVEFSYNQEDVASKRITIAKRPRSLKELLNEISSQADLQFRLIDGIVAVKAAGDLPVSAPVRGLPDVSPLRSGAFVRLRRPVLENRRQETIQGTVSDEQGNPLPGATVAVKGTDRATATGAEGEFTIAAGENDMLLVSSIGFLT